MQVGHQIKLIDLDAAANFLKGEFAGAKYSSGYIPPELLYLDQDGQPKVCVVVCCRGVLCSRGIVCCRDVVCCAGHNQ